MVYLIAKKVKGDFPKYYRIDELRHAVDKSIVDNETETRNEKHQASEREFSNLVGYSDL